MAKKKYPQYLSSPPQVLFFEIDEITIFFLALTLGLILEGYFYLLVIIAPYLYSKAKKNYPRGFLNHVTYFVGFTKMHGYPIFFEKEFYE